MTLTPTYKRVLLLSIALAAAWVLASMLWPAAVWADDPDPGDCVLCHQAETKVWQELPHAHAMQALDAAQMPVCQTPGDPACACETCHTTGFDAADNHYDTQGVTCTACHGSYVAGHPESGIQIIDVDSSVCQQCHADTHADWQQTSHGQAGVQCIGCHQSHSQELRLSGDKLCESCHKAVLEDTGHAAHVQSGLQCTTCHSWPHEAAPADNASAMPAAPVHDFQPDTQVCIGCHSDTFRSGEIFVASDVAAKPAFAGPLSVDNSYATECAAALDERSSFPGIVAAGFGLGLGVGGAIGVFIMIVLVTIVQSRNRP